MLKSEARKSYLEKRKALSSKALNIHQDLLLIRFQELELPYFELVHTYLPLYNHNEPDPVPMVDWLRFRDPGMKVACSRINPSDLSMSHFLQDEETVYGLNNYGIPEPTGGIEVKPDEIDAIFIPLLAFDCKGNRVGYGKGYYDRFLSVCRKDALKIGISFFPPVDEIADVDFFDKKLDLCITPEQVYAF